MTTPAQMVENYIRLRDYKKKADEEYKKSMERVNLAMDRLEGQLLSHLNETGANSVSCDAGTVYKNRQASATVQDQEVFRKWVIDTGQWDALDIRANKTFVKTCAEETGEIPPGVKFTQIDTVGVRRS